MGKLHCLFFVVWTLYIFQERGRKGMYEKTKEIYQFLLSQPDYFKEAGKDIDKAVEVFLKKGIASLRENEYEKVRDELFAVTSLAEETGFIKGFQYAVMLMSECYTAK